MRSEDHSTLDKHKEIVRQLYKEVWNNAAFNRVDEFIAASLTFHFRGGTHVQTPADLVRIVGRWRKAFPDLRFEVEEMIAEGDLVAARVVYQGTQRGEWKGIPATGRRVEVHEMIFFRFEDDRIVDVWEVADEQSQRQQLVGTDD